MMKLIALLKRRPGMTLEDFRNYYESTHSKFADALKGGKAVRYVRRYFKPIPHPLGGKVAEPEFDAMNEMWFEDEAQFQRAMEIFSDPALAKSIAQDEPNLFDVAKIRHYIVDEVDSDLS
jgi:uncharacterized protein (TIGR02118 family)